MRTEFTKDEAIEAVSHEMQMCFAIAIANCTAAVLSLLADMPIAIFFGCTTLLSCGSAIYYWRQLQEIKRS